MSALLGGSVGAWIGLVLILMGPAAFLTGQAIAGSWRPVWQIVPYGILLAGAARFLLFALFDGELLAIPGFLIDCAAMMGIALFAWRITHVHKLASQYPWLYRRRGLFRYEPIGGD